MWIEAHDLMITWVDEDQTPSEFENVQFAIEGNKLHLTSLNEETSWACVYNFDCVKSLEFNFDSQNARLVWLSNPKNT